MEILSPPREVSVGGDRNVNPEGPSTPLESFLRETNIGNNENLVPTDQDATPTARSFPRRVGSHHSLNNKPTDTPSATPAQKVSPPKETDKGDISAEKRVDGAVSHLILQDWKGSGMPKNMTQVDGSPARSYRELEPTVASSFKVLKAPSTMRSQPKTSHVDPGAAPTKFRSSIWRASSRESATSGNECDDEQVNDQLSEIKRDTLTINQMDGARECGPLSLSCRPSFRDLKKEDSWRRNEMASSLPVPKSRPHASDVQLKQPEGTLSASKVRGLAAMFDTAAKASPFVPTPGGAVQKKRRETARIISPYTSNASPRVSAQTATSVSTPACLMSPSKISVGLLGATDSIGKRSLIPRTPNLLLKDNRDKTDAIEKHTGSAQNGWNGSCLSGTSSTLPSRIPTPSRLPGKMKEFRGEPTLPQLDGSAKSSHAPLRLTPQHATRPTGYSPSAIPQLTNGFRVGRLPRLPQHSTESFYSDDNIMEHSKGLSLSSPRPIPSRNPSSLRERIRSLRSELSAKNEDCAQLRLEFEEFRKTKEVGEILLRENLDRARGEAAKWRRRAEKAERKVENFEILAARIQYERQLGRNGDPTRKYSFLSGSDHLDITEPSLQPLTAKMNQSVRRTPQLDENCADPSNPIGGGVSDCSENTILRNITGTTSQGDGSVGSQIWGAVDDLVDFASPGLADECL